MSRKLFVALSILVLASLSCSIFGAPAGDPAAPQDPNTLYADDFSDPSTGWGKQWDSNGTMTDYENGQYHIIVNYTENYYWGVTGRTFPNDVRIEADVTPQAGTPDTAPFGIICRYTDVNDVFNLYMLVIASNGYAAILKIENNNLVILSVPFSAPSPAIPTGLVTNHLRADCIGSTLTLYVNGTQVVSVTDSSIAAGDAGLVGGTLDAPGVDVFFDNFVVNRP